ncbi:MAG TPA: ROK family protein [Bacteroidaceae bacterium]|nr:ROK family protein [Bacteroidaceae bacterium]
MRVKKDIAIGADIGGSHISTAAIDINERIILKNSFAEADVDNKGTSDAIITSWLSSLEETIDSVKTDHLAGIGFAMPGPFQYDKGIAMFEKVEKYESLYGVDVSTAIRNSLNLEDDIPVRFMNDATAFAVGEAWMGKSAGFSRSLAITLGTGFGSAFINEGIPVVKGSTVPEHGCVWHLPFKKGISDDYISTRWFIKSYKEQTGKTVSGVRDLAERASEDPFVCGLFKTYGTNLGTILSPWLSKFGVEAVVIGGNISAAYSLYGTAFEETMKKYGLNICVELSELMERAAIIGSARLAEPAFWDKVRNLLKYM